MNDPWFITRDDGPVWLYITADVVNTCNKDLPDATPETYFAASRLTGVIDENVLIGDVIWLNNTDRYSEADNAVHLESNPAGDPARPSTSATSGCPRPLRPTSVSRCRPLGRFRYQIFEDAGINTWIRAFKASTNYRTVYDLASTRSRVGGVISMNWGNISKAGPATLYANACIAYTYWAWDEQENVNSVSSDEDPWSGTETPIRPVPNLLPLETQEVEASQFFLVGQSDGDAFGWLLFAWPGSNGSTSDLLPDLDGRQVLRLR